MRVFGKSNFKLKNLSAISKFSIPALTAILFAAYLLNWHSSAKTGRLAAISEKDSPSIAAASCGDGWDSRFGSGANGDVLAIAADASGNIYIGGDFTQVGGIAANHIAKWNGQSWSALGGGTDDYVSTIAISGNDVYAGGEFKNAGGIAAKYIARWNDANWSPLGAGTDSNVASIAISGSDVYAAGYFTNAGGASAKYIAKWNGANWSPLGNGFDDAVNKIVVAGGNLYAGGFFINSGDTTVNHIASWNGTSWSALGAGTDGDVYALAVSGNNLYVGGAFFRANDVVNTARIASWNGTNWSALGSGFNNTVYSIAVSGNEVFASGYFTKSSQTTANRVSRWNGSSWSALDSGTNGATTALTVSGNNIFAGGFFSTAGCHSSAKIARYFLQSFSGNGSNDWHSATNWANGAVPDQNSDVNIAAADIVISNSDATIRDLRVDEGRTLTISANRTLIVNGNLNLLGNINGAGTLVVSNCTPGAISRSGAGYIRLNLTRCVNNSGTFDFPVGTANGFSPVQLSSIVGSENFSVKANQGAYSGQASGLSTNRLQRFWNLTNGGITSANVQFNYLATDVLESEENYKIVRINGTTAENMAGTVNAANHTATVQNVSNFSPWTLGLLVTPTSVEVTIGGKITRANGRGIPNARIVLTGSNGITRYAKTNPFGFYRFNDVEVGLTYFLDVNHKRFTFESRAISITEEDMEINFTGQPIQ